MAITEIASFAFLIATAATRESDFNCSAIAKPAASSRALLILRPEDNLSYVLLRAEVVISK